MSGARRRRSLWVTTISVVISAAGCGQATSVESPSAMAPSPTVKASGSGTPGVVVRDGEPWIVYEGPVPDTNWIGNIVIRPDGADNHWATPGAPITTGVQPGDGWQLHPDWSPDGRKLAFVVDVYPSQGGHRDIWVSDADGTNAGQVYDCIAPCDTAEFPAWSKDGKSIMFVRWDLVAGVVDGSVLDLVDIDSGKVTTVAVTDGPEYFAYPRWSPDGRAVVTEIDTWTDTGVDSTLVSTSIAVVDLSSLPGKISKLTEPEQWAEYPDWHPKQDLIVFQSRPSESQDGPSDL
jgi:Tol biopolymer transport system component